MRKSRISVIGTGYVGLCTALGFASRGYPVVASDNFEEKVAKIQQGIPPFHEPGLPNVLRETTEKGIFRCLANSTREAVRETDITYVTVGTPSKLDGSIDLRFIESAATDIGEALKEKTEHHIVVVKSTVVPGTCQNVVGPILEEKSGKVSGKDFGLCMNPEFLRQGSAFKDTRNADRIVIGGSDKKSLNRIESLYKSFYFPNIPPIIKTSLATAELIKYASNAMLATKISTINTIANICQRVKGADIKVVATAMGLDKRIGPLFLDAGLGYGGSCFPKDLKALVACSKAFGYEPKLLEAVESVNKEQPLKAIQLCKQQLGSLQGKNIAILGLSFKPDTDDMREARVVPIINELLREGANVVAYDPVSKPVAQGIFENRIKYTTSAVECLEGADCCIVVTEWDEFKKLTPEDFMENMRQPIVVDGRRIYDPEIFESKIKFSAIGLG